MVANAIAWIVVAPVLDILIYAEPAKKVFSQGVFAFVANIIIVGVLGSLTGVGIQRLEQNHQVLQKKTKNVWNRLLNLKNFTFKYRSQMEPTLRDINLKIYPGEEGADHCNHRDQGSRHYQIVSTD